MNFRTPCYKDVGRISQYVLANLLLYGDSKFDVEKNAAIIRSSIKFIKDTARFKKLEAFPYIS